MKPADLVHFEGDFESHEKARIMEAVADAEEQLPEPRWRAEFGALWIISSTRVPGGNRVMTAHRIGAEQALVATTPNELVDKIRAYAR